MAHPTTRGVLAAGLAASLALGALALGGCVNSRVHYPFDASQTARAYAAASRTSAVYAYERGAMRPQNSVLDSGGDGPYRVRLLRFPSSGNNGQEGNLLSARYYQSTLPGRKPLVIVYPIWGSYDYPPDKISETLTERSRGGINVLRILGERDLFDWEAVAAATDTQSFRQLIAENIVERMRVTVIDTRRLVDWAEMQHDVDSSRIGLVGFSVGALVASLAYAGEPRISGAALVMGGARFHEILATCSGDPEQLRRRLLHKLGWTNERYQEELEAVFAPFDGVRDPVRVDPHRVILFDAYFDTCMPASSRDALWIALGRPERVSFLYDHKMSFLSMTPLGGNYMRDKVYEFLNDAVGQAR